MNEQANAPVRFVEPVQTVTAVTEAKLTDTAAAEANPFPSTLTELPTAPIADPGAVITRLEDVTKVADAVFDDASVARTKWPPAVEGGTRNVALNPPVESEVNVAWGAEEHELPPVQVRAWLPPQFIETVELAANPVPVTVTVVPTAPPVGESVILEVTVNKALAVLAFTDESVPWNV